MNKETAPPTAPSLQNRNAFFRFFFSPKTFHVTRIAGSVGILGYFLYWNDWGENNVIADLQKWSRHKFDQAFALSEEEKKIVREREQQQVVSEKKE